MCPSRGSKGWRTSLGTATALGQEVTHVTSGQMDRLSGAGKCHLSICQERRREPDVGEHCNVGQGEAKSLSLSLFHLLFVPHSACLYDSSLSCILAPLNFVVQILKTGTPVVLNVNVVDSAIRSI